MELPSRLVNRSWKRIYEDVTRIKEALGWKTVTFLSPREQYEERSAGMANGIKLLSARFMAERHSLMGFIYGMIRDLAATEDILQEVWIRLAEAAERGETIVDQAKWCRGVARNLILHHWREKRTAKVLADSELLELVEQALNEQPDPWAERRQALMECIDLLPRNSKQLLRMKYDQGLSFAAMALRLKRTVDALKMALCRVRQALLECASSRLRTGEGRP